MKINNRSLFFFSSLVVGIVVSTAILARSTFDFGDNVVKTVAHTTQRVKLGGEKKVREPIKGIASWYGTSDSECRGCSSHRITKCGVKYNETHYTLATGIFECGTEVWVVYGQNRVLAQVNDTGGFGKYGRIADLSKATFALLAPLSDGIIEVEISSK